ncbi:hypothetical protein AAG570_004219 [Ranatra chinensis]|uniref:Uncharacterized protein n=1 Tax=Ranatra chinensis TaxID=642074 RepID=A0ABD0Y3A1_9HEMI
MTIREKHWLASIQMMQLSTTTPFQDDYYFLMYQQRQSGHHGRKVGCPLKVARDSQCLIKPIYTPLQFENSLGKLQIGSVTAPRKIIDTDIVESVECTSTTTNSKKVKQILLEIERMFSDVLLAEEALSPMGNHSSDDLDPNQLFSKTVNILLKYDKLKTVLSIRKGKTLVLRVLSHLEVSRPLAHKVITILPSIAKKDTDQVMLSALPAIRHFLASATLEMLVDLSKYLESDLPFLLSNKLGISVLANMIERAEGQWAQVSEEGSSNWLEFVGKMVSTCQTTENIERPVVGIQGPVLSAHLARCPSTNNQHIAILHRALSTMNPKVEKL